MSPVAGADPPATRRDGEPPRDDGRGFERWFRWLAPLSLALAAVGAWDLVVRANEIPPYILPGPGRVLQSLVDDWPTLWPSFDSE